MKQDNNHFKLLFFILAKQAMVYRHEYSIQDLESVKNFPPDLLRHSTFSQQQKVRKGHLAYYEKLKQETDRFNNSVYKILDGVENSMTSKEATNAIDKLSVTFGLMAEEVMKAVGKRDIDDMVKLLMLFNQGHLDEFIKTVKAIRKPEAVVLKEEKKEAAGEQK